MHVLPQASANTALIHGMQKYRLYLKRLAGVPLNAPISAEALQRVQEVQLVRQTDICYPSCLSSLLRSRQRLCLALENTCAQSRHFTDDLNSNAGY